MHDRLTNENSELHAKVRLLQLDKEKLNAEIDKVGCVITNTYQTSSPSHLQRSYTYCNSVDLHGVHI